MVSPSEVQGFDQNVQNCTINYSIPPISQDHLKLWLQNAPNFSSNIPIEEDDDPFSNFQSEKSNPSENSSLEDIFLHGFDNAPSSNTRSSNDMQTRKSHGAGGKEGFESGEECKRQKRPRLPQVHNLNERLRRKKLTDKMTALQEMIPNSVKRDHASTLDDAIKYIKSLQFLVQTMSTEAGHALFHSPMMMLPQQIPSLAPLLQTSLAPLLQTRSCGNGMCLGMSIGCPVRIANPWLFQTSAASPGLQSVQNNLGQLREPTYGNSVSCLGSQPSIGANGETSLSQGEKRDAR